MNLLPLMSLLWWSPLAHAGARKLPEYDVSTEEAALKSAKSFKLLTKGKPKDGYPKRVAVPFFQVRYVFEETGAERTAGHGVTSISLTTLKFTDDEYTQLTDQLHAQLVARLEAEGFEVVPTEEVLATSAYAELSADEDVKQNGKRVVYAPSGMKNLPVFSGQPRSPGGLAAVAAEVGADAAVAAFVSIGICTMEPTKKTGMRSGVYPCIKGDLTMPGFNVTFLGASAEGKSKASWSTRLFKQTQMYTYNKGDKTVYDMALVGDWAAGTPLKRRFWQSDRPLSADEEGFVGGSGEIYDDLLAMGFAKWEDKFGGMREAVGLERRPVEPVQ